MILTKRKEYSNIKAKNNDKTIHSSKCMRGGAIMKFDPGVISDKKLIKAGLIQWSPLIANEKAVYITSLSRSFEWKILKRREYTIWVITLYNEELYTFNLLYSLEFAADNIVSTNSFLSSDLSSKAVQASCYSAPPSAHVYSFTVMYSPKTIYSTKIDLISTLIISLTASKPVISSKNYFFYFEFIPIDGYDAQDPNGYKVYVVKFTATTNVFFTATIDNLMTITYNSDLATMSFLHNTLSKKYKYVYLHGITEE